MNDVVEVRNENEKLKRQMEQMKNEDDKRKESGVYENNENVNTRLCNWNFLGRIF